MENPLSYRPRHQAIDEIFQILICDDHKLPAELPPSVESAIQSVKNAHPEATHHLFGGDELRSFIAANFDSDVVGAYDFLRPYAYKADLARYCLLYIRGGLYVDLGVRLLTRFEPPLGTGLAAFREYATSGVGPWWISISVMFAAAGRPELRTAIDLLVQNCKDRYYGPTALDPTGPGLFGRAVAICNNGSDYWIGDARMTTPEFDNKNVVYVTPEGRLLALRTKRSNFDEFAIDGTNNYATAWRSRQVYGEPIRCFAIPNLYTRVATRVQGGFLIEGGVRGCAVYGPYVPLPAGRYTISLWFDPDSQLGNSTIDICANFGKDIVKVLGPGEYQIGKDGHVTFDLELASGLQNVEVRLHVTGDCQGRFLRVEIDQPWHRK
jgi:Glycosyltransferase sugar-binding region containing DXD motif